MPPTAPDLRWPHLVVVHGGTVGMVFDLVRPEIIIGRAPDADIRLTGPTVSRRHAAVKTTSAQITIEDLGSRNGTFVDMDRVNEPRALRDGDHLTIGDSTLLKVTYAVSGEAAVRRAGFEHATRDPETLASNASYLFDRLRGDHAYARRHGSPLTLIFFRVNSVRTVPEGEGTAAPQVEYALRDVTKILRVAMRAEELLARANGAELVALLRSTERQATDMAERVRSRVAQSFPMAVSDGPGITLAAVIVPVSISVAVAPEAIMSAAHERACEVFAHGIEGVKSTPPLHAEALGVRKDRDEDGR